MIKIGCQTITWGGPKIKNNTDEVLQEVKKAGFNGVEIGARHLEPEKGDYYLSLLKENGLELVALHVGGDFTDPESVAKQLDNIETSIKLAKQLGAKMVFISGNKKEGKTMDEVRSQAAAYNKFGKLCKDYGLEFLYHNHNWEFANGGEEMKILINETDSSLVSFVVDVGWVTRGGVDPVEFIKSIDSRVKAIHFKEFASATENEFTELGKGIVNFKAVYDYIKNKGDMWVVSEQDRSSTTPLESATINCEYIKALIK